ncbi:MAG: replication initiator protein [Wigfec virus K19_180]|nr:MAG: replication initiator protein [Wigfec virus K19_180]
MAQCITPYYVRNNKPYGFNQSNWLPVPCGKCPICLARRSEGWIFRLKQQQKVSTNFNFITLTYNDENLPRTINGLATLKRSDLTNFFKRLRKLHGKSQTLKYYACGEYGSTFKRPHYHIILFNANPRYVSLAWKLQGKELGHVDIGDTTRGAIAYVTGYVMKGKIVPEHSRDDREKEYSVMSKGLGGNYINERTERYHTTDPLNCYLTEPGGKKIPMPRYYKDKLFSEEHRFIQAKAFCKKGHKDALKREQLYKIQYGTTEGYIKHQNEHRQHLIRETKKKSFASRKLAQ